jgi:hypothetical protein
MGRALFELHVGFEVFVRNMRGTIWFCGDWSLPADYAVL